jgi:hypothetical protein
MLKFLFFLLILWLIFRMIRIVSGIFQQRTKQYHSQHQQKKSPFEAETKIEDAEFEELPSESNQEKQSH